MPTHAMAEPYQGGFHAKLCVCLLATERAPKVQLWQTSRFWLGQQSFGSSWAFDEAQAGDACLPLALDQLRELCLCVCPTVQLGRSAWLKIEGFQLQVAARPPHLLPQK